MKSGRFCDALAWGVFLGLLFGMHASHAPPAFAESRQLLWGDTHLHSSNSFDAYLNLNMSVDPSTAYRYAKGLPVVHASHRARVQIRTPLDFLVIADHAEYLGVMRHIVERGIPVDDLGLVDRISAWYIEYWLGDVIENDEGMAAFSQFLPDAQSVEEAAASPLSSIIPNSERMQRTVWQEAIRIADEYNEPGEFTALIGWEWSSIPAGANLHRVVFTSSGADVASEFQPWSSADSMYPEDLWSWLDETAARTGAEFVSIPHNSNISKGYMFDTRTLRGAAYDEAKARERLRWEPVVEVTQFKGDSETHPDFSPEDSFADFELYPYYIEQNAPPYAPKVGDYIRPALLRGLEMESKINFNPYRFGLIGSTDSHTGLSSAEEPNFWGKFPRDSTPEKKEARWRPGRGPSGWSMSASGLAAVWAEENTRSSILEAFRRREVYATTGPRMRLRIFAGWDYEEADLQAKSVEEVGYGRGVPMGGELSAAPEDGSPRFLIHALKDPGGAHLDRVQVVKGWVDASGKAHERVIDVMGSGDRIPDARGMLPPVGNTVDPETARYSNTIGAAQLSAFWRDPDFDPAQRAFYYIRVLQIPTPRHSLFDAIALRKDPEQIDGPWWIQERAYTSPIFYSPYTPYNPHTP